ncbi:MAG: hypothetical protein KAQ62_07435, partial [Cyclobacteriaceae bacterium]|nr:hypothetical protein [Cyclobacteriaceae bacterium]
LGHGIMNSFYKVQCRYACSPTGTTGGSSDCSSPVWATPGIKYPIERASNNDNIFIIQVLMITLFSYLFKK